MIYQKTRIERALTLHCHPYSSLKAPSLLYLCIYCTEILQPFPFCTTNRLAAVNKILQAQTQTDLSILLGILDPVVFLASLARTCTCFQPLLFCGLDCLFFPPMFLTSPAIAFDRFRRFLFLQILSLSSVFLTSFAVAIRRLWLLLFL